MFLFLKYLLGSSGNEEALAAPASPEPARAVVPAPERQVIAGPPAGGSDGGSRPEASPSFSGASVVAVATPVPPPAVAFNLEQTELQRPKPRLERLLLPLKMITDQFPPALQPVLAQAPSPNVMVALSVETVMEQLPKGRVEVSIGELRAIAPVGAFVPDTSHDCERVELPLKEIFVKLNPTFLPRRTQRRVELPTEMGGVFVKKPGFTSSPMRAVRDFSQSPKAPEAPRTQEAENTEKEMVQPPPEAAAITAPEPSPIKTESLAASAEMQALFSHAKPHQALPDQSPAPPSADPSGPVLRLCGDARPAVSVAPAAPVAPQPSEVPSSPPEPEAASAVSGVPETPAVHSSFAAAPAPVPMAPVNPPDAAVVPARGDARPPGAPPPARVQGPTVAVPLGDISGAWPQEIQDQIARLRPNLLVACPIAALGEALKSGKIVFSWEQIRWWIVPPVRISPVFLDAIALELPLPVVAPLFMAAAGPVRPARRMPIVDAPFPQTFMQARKQPMEEVPPPQSHAAERGAETEAERPPLQSIPFTETSHLPKPVLTSVQRDDDLPSMLVERACALNGVSGAIVALAEGLLVAAKTPPELKAETLAAFLPQVFSRVEQATGPMQIGELQSLLFTAGDRPWQIWKAGSLFFAAMGRPHELLPTAQLRVLVSQLALQSRKDAEARRT